jgi:hypothetical protein
LPRNPTQTTHDLRKPQNGHVDKWGSHLTLQGRGKTTWLDANPELLRSAIAAATEDGAGLLLSKTSDGGALSIYVLTDGGTHKLYPATAEELAEALQLIVKIAV